MIKTITGIPNVTLIPNNATALGMFGNGESYTHFSMAVPEGGFKYYVETTLIPEMEKGPIGWLTFQFNYPKSINTSIEFYRNSKWRVSYRTYNGTKPDRIGITDTRIDTKTLVFGVYPDGLVTGYPMDYVTKFNFPPLNTLPAFGNGKRILKVRLSWTNMTLPFFLKFPWSVRILTRESTTMTTEMPTTTKYLEDSLTTTSNNLFLRDKWWLIVNIGTTFVIVSSVMSAFFIYKSFCLRASSNSDDVSTTMDPQTSKVPNANSGAITSEDLSNQPSMMPES
uniref:CUB_2 domain-containing protein n=1 Tax=Panagrellus redivivus TaxID=6233 RepID=A0A7E4ZYL6_PANRE